MKSSVGERAAETFRYVARLITMLEVEEFVEGGMEGLDLRLGSATKESMPLSELHRVPKHVQLRKGLGTRFRFPVLLNVIDHTAPGIDISSCPVFGVEQRVVQLLQQRERMECEAVVAAGRADAVAAVAMMVELHSFLIHRLVS